jgi:hypothetical protein
MPAQKKREYWQFIDLIAKPECRTVSRSKLKSSDASGAYCKECRCRVPYSVGNTIEVRKHMENHHSCAVDSFVKLNTKPSKKKQTLVPLHKESETEVHQVKISVTEEQQLHCNRLVAGWVAQSMRPFRVVEDAGFVKFVTYISKQIGGFDLALPKRKEVREEVRLLAKGLRSEMQAAIDRECSDYSITTDMWTDRSMRSFLSLTLHFIDNNFELQNIVLEVEAFRGKHSGIRIGNALDKALRRWRLDKNNCTLLIRDGASNAISAARTLGLESMSCIAHSLHLVVGAALSAKRPKKKHKCRHHQQQAYKTGRSRQCCNRRQFCWC